MADRATGSVGIVEERYVSDFVAACAVAIVVAVLAFNAAAVRAQADESTGHNVQALQFGMFFGGAALQYDHCVQLGRITGGPRSAEAMATDYLKNAAQFAGDAKALEDVNKGWFIAREKIAEQDSQYWTRRCDEIDGQWRKYVDMLKLQ